MGLSVRVMLPLILAAGLAFAPAARAQDPADSGEPRRKDLTVRDFFYRLGPGYEAGPARIHAFASQWLVFDDNIFLVDPDVTDEVEELSLETILGARAEVPYLTHLFLAEYQVELIDYLLEDTKSIIRHQAVGEALLDFDRTYAEANVRYRNTDDPVDQPELSRFRRAEILANALAGHRLDRIRVEGGVHDHWYDYFNSASEYLSHNELWLHAQGSYQVSEKLEPYVRFEYGMATFTGTESRPSSPGGAGITLNDYQWSKLWLGAYAAPAEKLYLHARLGGLFQTVDEDSGTVGDDNEYGGLAVGLAATYQATPKFRLGGSFTRDIQFSGFGNYLLIHRFDVRGDYDATEKIIVSGLLFYELNDPSNDGADSFNRLGGSAILTYQVLEWLSAGFQYQYRQRTGLDPGDYASNRVMGNVTVYF